MTFRHIQTEALTQQTHAHVPAVGGVDKVTPKSLATPGTLFDCMNFEVGEELGYSVADGLFRWSGKTNSDVKQWFEADITGGTGPLTFRRGGVYTVESTITGDTAQIKILDINDDISRIKFQVIGGDWFNSVYEDFDVTFGGSQESFITSDDDQFRVLQTP